MQLSGNLQVRSYLSLLKHSSTSGNKVNKQQQSLSFSSAGNPFILFLAYLSFSIFKWMYLLVCNTWLFLLTSLQLE